MSQLNPQSTVQACETELFRTAESIVEGLRRGELDHLSFALG